MFQQITATSDQFTINGFKVPFTMLARFMEPPAVNRLQLEHIVGRLVKLETQHSVSLVDTLDEADGVILDTHPTEPLVLVALHQKFWQIHPTERFTQLPTIILSS